MNNNASYFIELTFSTLYSFFLSCLCFLWPASFLSKIINMGAWLPATLSMQPWWWVMMQPASVSRQKVSVLTSHSLIAWITIWTYHLDSHLRRRGFVHLLPGCLPDACCFIFLAIVSTCFPFLTLLNSCHDFTIAGESICQSGKYCVTIINSTFRCFCCMQSCHFLWFLFQVARAPSTNSQSGYFFMSILVWKNLLLNPMPVFNCPRWWILL
jgi:hypothetical protein